MNSKALVVKLTTLLATTVMVGGLVASTAAAASTGIDPKKLPDKFPIPAPVNQKLYAYDDMSKHFNIELMANGFFNQPIPNDYIKTYLEKKFNVTLTFDNLSTADLENQVATRFAGGNAPDAIFLWSGDKPLAFKLFDQGQLISGDQVAPYMPQLTTYLTKDYYTWANDNGQLVGLPRYGTFADNWGYFIRQDWLKELHMSVPKTTDQLFAFAKAVHYQLPRIDHKQHWFMGGAGQGQGFGMLAGLEAFFGTPSWSIVNGKLNNPMLDGTHEKFLEFLHKLYVNNLLTPDWYTIGWEPFKSYSYNDKVGMLWYPGNNLASEMMIAAKNNPKVLSEWTPVAPLNNAKYPEGGTPGGIYIFPKQLANDPGKMKRVLHLLDSMIYPNANYWNTSQSGGPNDLKGIQVTFDAKTGRNIFDHTKVANYAKIPTSEGDWQTFGYTLIWQTFTGQSDKLAGNAWTSFMEAQPRYQNLDMLLSLDGTTSKQVTDFQNRNDILFVLGKRSFSDWHNYVQEWKNAGGQKLMDEAAKQLGVKE